MKMNPLDWVTLVLVVIGGINWGLVGLIDLDLVAAVFGVASFVTRALYILVGLSAIYMIVRAASQSENA